MSCLAGDVDEGGAAAEGSCPRMGFGECLLQDGIRGRNCLTCDDPGLDPPPFEGEGPRDQAKLWRERVGGNTEGCRQRIYVKAKGQVSLGQMSGCDDRAKEIGFCRDPFGERDGPRDVLPMWEPCDPLFSSSFPARAGR